MNSDFIHPHAATTKTSLADPLEPSECGISQFAKSQQEMDMQIERLRAGIRKLEDRLGAALQTDDEPDEPGNPPLSAVPLLEYMQGRTNQVRGMAVYVESILERLVL